MTRRLASRNRYTPGASGIVPDAGRKLVDRRTTVARLRLRCDGSPRSRPVRRVDSPLRDRDRVSGHRRRPGLQRAGGRTLGDGPVGDVVLAAMARTYDLAVVDPAHDAPLVRT